MKRITVRTAIIVLKIVVILAILDWLIFGLDSDRPDAMTHTLVSWIAIVISTLLIMLLIFRNRDSK